MSERPEKTEPDNPPVAEGSESAAIAARRRARSLAIALVLGGLVVLFYVATIVRLGGNVAKRAL